MREAIAAGERDYALLEARAHLGLLEAGMRPDYFSVRAAKTLEPASSRITIWRSSLQRWAAPG